MKSKITPYSKTMKKMNVGLACVLGGLGVIASSMTAQALDFNFSFSTSIDPGTVSGVIRGLNEGTNVFFDLELTGNNIGVPAGTRMSSTNQALILVENGNITKFTNIEVQSGSGAQMYMNMNTGPNEYMNWLKGIGTEPGGMGSPVQYDVSPTSYPVSAYNFSSVASTAVPFDFNPAEGAALGVPLFIGLGILRKKVARKSTASKAVVAVS